MRTWAEISADARPGRAFSNHSHWEVWASRPGGCYRCTKDGQGIGQDDPQCPIFGVALCNGTTPAEWTERTSESIGDYVCAEYDERHDDGGPDDDGPDPDPDPDPGPPPVMEGQTDIFEVFAEQVITGSTTERLEAAR